MKHYPLICLVLLSISLRAQNLNLDSIKKVTKTAKGKAKIQSLLDLSWEYRFVNADTARIYGTEALNLARTVGNRDLEAQALHNIGVTHEAQGNYAQAMTFQKEALSIWQSLGDEAKSASALNTLGIIHDEMGAYHDALKYYHDARQIYEKLKDDSKIAMVLVNMGIVLKAQKDYKLAAINYKEAQKIYTRLDKKFGAAACNANLGSVFYYLSKYDSSLHYSLLATEQFTQQNIRQFLASSLCNAGMALSRMQRLAEARDYLNRSLKLHEEYDNKKEIAFVYMFLAGIARTEHKLAEAEQLAGKALALAIKINAQQQVLEAREELAQIFAEKRDYKSAWEELQRFNQVKDTLFNQEKSRQIAELQTKYETEKKESEIQLLRQENELKDSRLQRNQLMVVALVITMSGLIVLAFLWRNRIMLKQKVELEATKAALRESQLHAAITSQEEERRRFAADLHDGMGQLISAVKLNLTKDTIEKSSVDHAVEVLNEMNTEIRNIAFNLMPHILMTGGLIEALTELSSRINRTGKVQVTVTAYDVPKEMSSDRKVALYRVCQEWINNVLKYSNATQLTVQLVQHDKELLITIEDNGDGFDSQKLSFSKGNGWRNIHSRLTLIHGEIEVDSQPGRKGTTVVVTVPSVMVQAA